MDTTRDITLTAPTGRESHATAGGSPLTVLHNGPDPSQSGPTWGYYAIASEGGRGHRLKGNGTAPVGGRRGVITQFSRASSNRLRLKCASINQHKAPLCRYFTTLTYPRFFPAHSATWTAHRKAFIKRLQRAFPDVAGVWKLEPQERQAPHFHLIILSRTDIPTEWIAQAWWEVVGTGRWDHALHGTDHQELNSWNGVMSYASKYIAKAILDDLPDYWHGCRWCGQFGKLPISLVEYEMNRTAFVRARRTLRRYAESQMGRKLRLNRSSGMTSYMGSDAFQRLISYCLAECAAVQYTVPNVYERCRRQHAGAQRSPRPLRPPRGPPRGVTLPPDPEGDGEPPRGR